MCILYKKLIATLNINTGVFLNTRTKKGVINDEKMGVEEINLSPSFLIVKKDSLSLAEPLIQLFVRVSKTPCISDSN